MDSAGNLTSLEIEPLSRFYSIHFSLIKKSEFFYDANQILYDVNSSNVNISDYEEHFRALHSGQCYTRVAVVTYSTNATIDVNDLAPDSLSDRETKCSLYDRLDGVVARTTPYGYTATHEALQRATDCLVNSRHHAKKARAHCH